MKVDQIFNEEHNNLLDEITQRDEKEKNASAAITSEILNKLNVNIQALPQKCQQILIQTAESQKSTGIEHLDPIAISLQHSKILSEKLEQDYEILKLKQNNAELQAKIDRNNKFLAELRRDLESSKSSLSAQNPSPENIQEHIRQLRQKVASYEESCEKAKMKYTKLSVPDGVLPMSLMTLVSTLAALNEEAASLKQRADDIALARQARDTFNRLRR
ncbi:uncharacterized protein LOC114366324 [Ostrinia furnacalis]|uniref:uncharacterized protein LOC114366324 n=1 Tax=Ostrinia furnacalis TaxID=93504 RepID=UPI00103DCBEC|nr:uncharacterized protein LOC114366324 [Ostrinia furnacalis]